MSTKRIYQLQADLCKAMAHPLRLEILEMLSDKECSFSSIQEKTGELKSNLSQHLNLMVKSGMLNSRREGQTTYFSIASKKVTKAFMLIRDILEDYLKKQKKLLAKL